jgi:hypothetical protein
MTHHTNWLPATRDGQLAMATDWMSVAGTNAQPWSISAAALQELGGLL